MTYVYYNGSNNTIYEICDVDKHILLQQILRGLTILLAPPGVIYLGEL